MADKLAQVYYQAVGLLNYWNANGGAGIANATTAPTFVAASGGAFAAGTYSYRYTWLNARGETLGSVAASQALTLNQKCTVTIPALPAGATSANIYRSLAPTGSELLVGNTATTSFVDNGNAATGGAVPSSNTTGLIPNDSEVIVDGSGPTGDGRSSITGIQANNVVVRATDIKNLCEGSVAVSTNDASKAVLNTILTVAVNPGS